MLYSQAANVAAQAQAEEQEVQDREAERSAATMRREQFMRDAEAAARALVQNARVQADHMKKQEQERQQQELQVRPTV